MFLSRDDVSKLLDALEHASVSAALKPWGHEICFEGDGVLVKLITVNKGHRTSLQRHARKDEILLITNKQANVERRPGTYSEPLVQLPVYRMLPGTVHRVTGPATMIEISTNDPDDVERLDDDYNR